MRAENANLILGQDDHKPCLGFRVQDVGFRAPINFLAHEIGNPNNTWPTSCRTLKDKASGHVACLEDHTDVVSRFILGIIAMTLQVCDGKLPRKLQGLLSACGHSMP